MGFFDLFDNKPLDLNKIEKYTTDLNFVRYMRGLCSDPDDAKSKKIELKREIFSLVGDDILKWTFLHSGLSEAVTNVTHHAYPEGNVFIDKSWYLTGSFNNSSREMKIAFYDQGVGIPKSLPASKIYERVLNFLTKTGVNVIEKMSDKVLLEAAMSIDRTSTEKNDRGKGLQDLIEFIKQRGQGYISILSYKGLYKFTLDNNKEHVKTASFDLPLCGTLIIWSVTLDNKEPSNG
ncbi:hypothetical protein KDN34_14295 [Shewanella yunxiaonensis]|uniref:ATP-binding protein n=1 Tax=Shewanella yunxiaonensis TaxID=2829809 RepID=A0ABX7YRG3_9GAMM|nr:hypothetical protein [Shewanella yunxiaonensis]QUN05353.1 hypothetical protein KDN34_14295 [Shewanella yunxiaonensis]